MKLQGNHHFPTTPETVWSLITDPNTLTAVIPGCQHLIPITETQYQGELIIPIGPMAGIYKGNLSLSHIVENKSFAFTFTAQSQTSTIGGNGRLHLQAEENGTLLRYEIEAKVGGQLTVHATPLLETNARALIRQTMENLGHLPPQGTSQSVPIQTTMEPASEKAFSDQQITLIIIASLAAILLFFLLFFFRRRNNQAADT